MIMMVVVVVGGVTAFDFHADKVDYLYLVDSEECDNDDDDDDDDDSGGGGGRW